MADMKKAVVTVLGIDRKGIIARVGTLLYEHDVNILDISQTVVSEYFNMVLIADISAPTCAFDSLSGALQQMGEEMGLQIRIQRNEIFDAMYRI